MTDWARQFSLPYDGADERIFDTVVGAHGSAVATLFVTRHHEQIARTSDGLIDFVLDWAQQPASLDPAWDLAFGRAQLALKSGRLDPSELAVRLALRLTESGHRGAWRGTMPSTSVRLGPTLLRSVEEVEVGVDGDLTRVSLRQSDGTRRRSSIGAGSGAWETEGAEHLPSVGVGRVVHLMPRDALPESDDGTGTFDNGQPVAAIDAAMAATFANGISAIAEHSPGYLQWVQRVLRGVVVCPADSSFRVVSGSGEDAPGIIHASYPLRPMDVAEILVHECAHQYFYMLERVGPVDDGTDAQLYWSPPIRKHRPLSRILMAYHALANVLLFYAAVRANGGGAASDAERYVAENEADMVAAVADLDIPLRGNAALTACGRGLYEPLAERVAALQT